MSIIPILRCRDMKESIFFYTQVLDFELAYPDDSDSLYQILIREGARLDLSADDGEFGSCVNIEVEDVDKVFTKFKERGLNVSGNGGVHGQPTDQTWGMREFYIEDPNGNTLRFGQEIA